jgi:hypothetical protein
MNVKEGLGGGQQEGWEKGKNRGVKRIKIYCTHTHMHKLHTETCQTLSERRGTGEMGILWRGKFVQSTLHTHMELSQWKPLRLLMYANSKTE